MIYSQAEATIIHNKTQALLNDNKFRMAEAARALDFLQFRQEEYIRHIIYKRYPSTCQDVEKYICTVPLTRALVNQRAKIFSTEPVIDLKNQSENSPVRDALYTMLDRALFNYHLLCIDRYVEANHNIGVIPHYDAELDRIHLEILTADRVVIWQDEKLPTKAVAVAYPIGRMDNTIIATPVNKYAYWTKDFYSEVTLKTDYSLDTTLLKEPNPYKRIPIVWFRNELPVDTFWLDNGYPIIDCNEKADIQLTNLDIGTDFQSFATLITEGLPDETKITGGVTRYLNLPADFSAGGITGKAYYINPNVNLKGVWDVINEAISMTASLLGISTDSIRQGSNYSSGYQLRLSKSDIVDYNNDKKPMYREAVRNLVQLCADCLTIYSKKVSLPNDMDLSIDFADVKIETNPIEEEQIRAMKISNGTMSRVDAIMQDNPDLTREDAIKEIERIDLDNRTYRINPAAGLEGLDGLS